MSLRITAGAVAAAAVAGLATLLVPRESAANVTLAEVQATVGKTQTVIVQVDRKSTPAAQELVQPYRMLIRAPSLVRIEQPDGGYTVTDFTRRRCLFVTPARKSARVLEGLHPPGGPLPENLYDLFRTIADRPIRTLPPRSIDGAEAVGFVVKNPLVAGRPEKPAENETTVWVDPKTKLPLLIEIVTRDDGVTTTESIHIVAFDRPLEAALFELNPPAGYAVETLGIAELPPAPAAEAKDAATEMVATPLIGLGPVKFGMKLDDVIRVLGKPDKTVSPNKDYTLLEYYSRGFSVHTTPQRGVIMISCYTGKFWAFSVRAFAGRTDKGVKMGAGRVAIEAAYGKPSSVREATMKDMKGKRAANPDKKTGQVDLTYSDLRLLFSLHDDSLDSIMLSAPRPSATAKETAKVAK